MELQLTRFAYTPVGTFGSMMMPDGQQIYTVEDPWKNNQPSISCIPAGQYACVPRPYHRGGYPAIHITEVENRSHILFHRGNTELDVEGCIVTGMQLGFIQGRWAVSDSRGAFEVLMHHYGNQEFTLVIDNFDPDTNAYESLRTADNADRSLEVYRRFGVLLEVQDITNYQFLGDKMTKLERSTVEEVVRGMYQARINNDVNGCRAFFSQDAHLALVGEDEGVFQSKDELPANIDDKIAALVNAWQWIEMNKLRLLVDGNQVASLYELTTVFTPTGETITTSISDHLVVDEHLKISELIEFVDTALVARLAAQVGQRMASL